jgi:CRP-like cAMP-binding protein
MAVARTELHSVADTAPGVTVPLLRVDPDLGAGLDRHSLATALQEVRVPIARIDAGPWRPPPADSSSAFGLLIVDGLVVCETAYADNVSGELLGPGDLFRPWQLAEDSLIAPRTSWFVACHTSVAVIDGAAMAALAGWPSIVAELFARTVRRARALSMLRAIGQVRRLEHRMLLHLWWAAERLGRVTPAGLVVRLPLTHERLAAVVGAHRPSLTSALLKLERSGYVVRRGDEIVLTPPAREAARELAGRLDDVA